MDVLEQQALINKATRDQWDLYQSHRDRINHLVIGVRKQFPDDSAPTLAVLGVGNGNDIDLKMLSQHFAKIHLFDCDPNALDFLTQRQLTDWAAGDRVVIEPAVDLTSIADTLNQLPTPLSEPFVAKILEEATEPDALEGRSFDVVLSSCMLTQLLASVVESFGDDSAYKNDMMLAVRNGHVKLISRLVKPNGVGVLVSDFVSSDTLPELKQTETKEDIRTLSQAAVDQKNFFTGANPFAIRSALEKVVVEIPSKPITIEPPWRWQIGADRYYLVTAIGFHKSSASK